jgi:hypothetical protein
MNVHFPHTILLPLPLTKHVDPRRGLILMGKDFEIHLGLTKESKVKYATLAKLLFSTRNQVK